MHTNIQINELCELIKYLEGELYIVEFYVWQHNIQKLLINKCWGNIGSNTGEEKEKGIAKN